jgi:hypothetical protein
LLTSAANAALGFLGFAGRWTDKADGTTVTPTHKKPATTNRLNFVFEIILANLFDRVGGCSGNFAAGLRGFIMSRLTARV